MPEDNNSFSYLCFLPSCPQTQMLPNLIAVNRIREDKIGNYLCFLCFSYGLCKLPLLAEGLDWDRDLRSDSVAVCYSASAVTRYAVMPCHSGWKNHFPFAVFTSLFVTSLLLLRLWANKIEHTWLHISQLPCRNRAFFCCEIFSWLGSCSSCV